MWWIQNQSHYLPSVFKWPTFYPQQLKLCLRRPFYSAAFENSLDVEYDVRPNWKCIIAIN